LPSVDSAPNAQGRLRPKLARRAASVTLPVRQPDTHVVRRNCASHRCGLISRHPQGRHPTSQRSRLGRTAGVGTGLVVCRWGRRRADPLPAPRSSGNTSRTALDETESAVEAQTSRLQRVRDGASEMLAFGVRTQCFPACTPSPPRRAKLMGFLRVGA